VTGDIPFSPGTVGVSASFGSTGEMFQGFPGDPDSRGSTSPSLESQYLSSVESFGSPPTTSAPQVSHSIYSRFNIVFVRANCFAKQHGSCEMCLFLLDKRSDVAKRMRFNSFECLDALSRNRIQQNTDKSACARNQFGSNVVGLQHAAKQMTNPWNSPAFAHEAPPCAQRCCSRFSCFGVTSMRSILECYVALLRETPGVRRGRSIRDGRGY